MNEDKTYYLHQLYPLQDQVLRVVSEADTSFYLTGGTAVSRVYLHHRFSDDLDLFVNWDKNYKQWCDQILALLSAQTDWQLEISTRQQYYTRVFVHQANLSLKIELINDVLSHVGGFQQHPVLGKLDSAENILANKLTALLGREEARDLADVWGLCTKLGLSIKDAIAGAQSKSSGISPVGLARRLCTATHKDWEQVRWINAPEPDQYLADLFRLGEGLVLV